MLQQKPQITTSLDSLAAADLTSEQTFDSVSLRAVDAAGILAGNLSFNEAVFDKVQLVGAKLEKLGLMDVRLGHGDLSGANCSEGSVIRAEINHTRLTGTDLSRSNLKDVTFANCKLDMTNFRYAKLTRVRFVDCQLTDTDFMGATLEDVSFEGCALDKTAFDQSKSKRLDFRTSQLIEIRGWRDLREACIDSAQLVTVAPQLAAALELNVRDQEEI